METNEPNDLSLIPTSDLFNELMKRSSGFVGVIMNHEGDEKAFAKGNPRWMVGACQFLIRDIISTPSSDFNNKED